MQAEQLLSFGPYQLAPGNGQLWKGTQAVKLTPKSLAVLCYLVDREGQVVTKEELFQAVWADTVVSDAALTVCIQELRRVLRDDAYNAHYIETVHRRGFRFIAKIVSRQNSQPSPSPQHPTPSIVGREAELQQLHEWLDKALSGERQLLFVTGEPGIGKTSLVDAFRQRLETGGWGLALSPQASSLKPLASPVSFAHGQCIEHYGTGEPYLPVLEALGRLCREPDGAQLVAVLKQYAPTWLVQLPSLLTTAEATALQGKTAGATQVRMLRELAEAIEEMTTKRPLVLWLEDLHWSDVSTLDWLAFIARRRERARLMIIGTYRPVEVLAREHPLKAVKQELHLHGQCQELTVDFLREKHVAEYLVKRFTVEEHDRASFHRLARAIHQRTDGNPLFMVNVVDQLLSQGVFVQADGQWTVQKERDTVGAVPEGLRQMIEQQVERLSVKERGMLEAASVAGVEFSAAAVAAGVGTELEAVEEQCTGLARRDQFLRLAGTNEWPDGTVATRYSFLHALYQEVVYERIPVGQRVTLHKQIGEREEAAYGERAREIAVELAVHFERGRDYRRAVQYLQQAGENAVRRSAHQEAINLLTKGLKLLKVLPDTPECTRQELTLQAALGQPLIATKGYGAPEVERIYTRALELCEQVGEALQLFPVLFGLWVFYLMRIELQTARERAEQLLRLAHSAHEPAFLLEAHRAVGSTLYFQGELASARTHLEQALILYNPQQHRSHAFRYGQDPGVVCRTYASRTLWYLGYPDQALQRSSEALTLARESSIPFDLAHALVFAAELHTLRREFQVVQERAEATIALCAAQEFPAWLAYGTMLRGLALTEQGQSPEGIAQMGRGLAAFGATGAEAGRPDLLVLLAEAYGKAEQTEDGLAVLAEAFPAVERMGMHHCAAELYRLKGELTLAQSSVQSLGVQTNQKAKGKRQKAKIETSPQPLTPSTQAEVEREAEECFLKAIEIAQRQQAKSLELRATMSLARLWQQQGRQKEAHQMLSEIYGWFTEGFDTKDLQEAKALIEELSH